MSDRAAAEQLAAGTHIPTCDLRWLVTERPHKSGLGQYCNHVLQQRCTTTGGQVFWKDVPMVLEQRLRDAGYGG